MSRPATDNKTISIRITRELHIFLKKLSIQNGTDVSKEITMLIKNKKEKIENKLQNKNINI